MTSIKQKITPNLWFDRQVEEAAKFYVSTFKNSRVGKIMRASKDLWGELMLGSTGGVIKTLPAMLPLLPYFRLTMQQFAERFSNPFLKKAFPLLEYSIPAVPFFIHLAKHAYGFNRDIAWPVVGAYNAS